MIATARDDTALLVQISAYHCWIVSSHLISTISVAIMAYTDDAVKAKLSALNETQEGIVTVAQWVLFHR